MPLEHILAVTFTKKAAGEMRERLTKLFEESGYHDAGLPRVGTFHSLGAALLRRRAQLIDERYNSRFSILDEKEALKLLERALGPHPESAYWKSQLPGLAEIISLAKGEMQTAQAALDSYEGQAPQGVQLAATLWPVYEELKRRANVLDYDDLIYYPVLLYRRQPELARQDSQYFQQVLVDEYQDTNTAQYELVCHWTQSHRNLFVVGDPDQAIYGWRGADVRNILNFKNTFPQAQVYYLTYNYRSRPEILSPANTLIQHNKERLPKDSVSVQGAGGTVTVKCYESNFQEAVKVAEAIERSKSALNEEAKEKLAILYRTHAQSRLIEQELAGRGIPYQIVGGVSFYERREVRDALAYLRLAVNPADDAAFTRIINTPKRGLGEKAWGSLRSRAEAQKTNLWSVLAQALDEDEQVAEKLRKEWGIAQEAWKNLRTFGFWMTLAQGNAATSDPSVMLEGLLQSSGYYQMLTDELKDPKKKEEAAGRLENLEELLIAAEKFAGVARGCQKFLETVALLDAQEALEDKGPADKQGGKSKILRAPVCLITVHGAKGLEFKEVFLVGWEENVFPHKRIQQEGPKGLEEERRCAYVALTRAEQALHVSFCESRRTFGKWVNNQASRFLRESGLLRLRDN